MCSAAQIWAAVDLGQARRLELVGNYAEAADIYATAAEEFPLISVLGNSRCQAAIGEVQQAEQLLQAALEPLQDDDQAIAKVSARLAKLQFEQGRYDEAAKQIDNAVQRDSDELLAHWIKGELARVTGQLDEANSEYQWLVDYYNDHDVRDPDDLRVIGLGAAQFARWNRQSDQFTFLVSDLFPAALETEENYWPSHYESGVLFLEKYNQAEAQKSLDAALKINPNAAEIHAARAALHLQNYNLDQAETAIDRALQCNPKLLQAHQLKADLLMANFEVSEAAEALEAAIEYNPASEETLGRLAATYLVLDGYKADLSGTRAGNLIDEVVDRNAHAGPFFLILAEQLEARRKFDAAERFFREALDRLPQLIGPRSGLGLMYMRIGREDQARELFDEAFEVDPFNVRVSNMLKVLEVLDEYTTLETDHFLIRYDPAKDSILARYMGRYLEELYPGLCDQLGYEPAEKSLFEIFSTARNTNGHGWFSARMIGLPYVGTVGACAGTMVALASPNDAKQTFNWAQVVKHEFVHVINLQQTQFNIPHWFTEALAVWNEGYPRSESWNEMLAERVPRGDVFTLENLNLGFIRPKSGLDWQMAYCQAELYADYMLETYGETAFAKLLTAFTTCISNEEAIRQAFDVPLEEFERGYTQYVNEIVDGLSSSSSAKQLSQKELRELLAKDPQNPEALSQLAVIHISRREYPQARRLAEQVLKENPQHQLANYVIARLYLVTGEGRRAIEVLTTSLDEQAPQENSLALLAALMIKAKDFDEAARLYSLGREYQPANPRWLKGLARVYLGTNDEENLVGLLEEMTLLDADDAQIRVKLAQMAADRGDDQQAAHWAWQAIYANVLNEDAHRIAAEVALRTEDYETAGEELVTLVDLRPDDPQWHEQLVALCMNAPQPEQIRKELETLVDRGGDYRGAAKILLRFEL